MTEDIKRRRPMGATVSTPQGTIITDNWRDIPEWMQEDPDEMP